MANEIQIALLGQPNSGKSTLFNTLTGAHQHVGNWPGKTVEKKEGYFSHGSRRYLVSDLPGSYSLSANSDEEIITRDTIAGGGADLVCVLADASQLERNLFMLADIAGIRTPVLLVLTMIDVAVDQGKKIDVELLSKRLNIPVAAIVAPDKGTYQDFFEKLDAALDRPVTLDAKSLYRFFAEGSSKGLYEKALALAPDGGMDRFSKEWLAIKLLEQDEVVAAKIAVKAGNEAVRALIESAKDGPLYAGDCKFAWIESVLDGVIVKTKEPSRLLTRFDRAAIHPFWGKPIAIGLIILGLIGSMIVAAPIMGLSALIPPLLGGLVEKLAGLGVAESLISFIKSTLVLSLSWTLSMLGFVFGVNLVFGLIEEIGYMARVSYVFDNAMYKLGLQGKSVMPMLISVGCTIGGAAGTRVVDSWGQRILTIALVWAVPCGATFAVIPTLASAFFGWGSILVMLLLFAIMFVHIFITAKIFGRTLNPVKERTGLIMELPPYHKPRWGAMFRMTLNRVWEVFKKAFAVVFIVSVIFYFMSYSSDGNVEGSFLYLIGKAIEPVTRIFGLGWQTFLAFVASMVSKEAVLGVLSAIFAGSGSIFASTVGTAAKDANLSSLVSSAISKPEALAFMVAVTFNVPCVMALSSTYQETHSLGWTLKIALYYIATALILSMITYHVAGLFF